MVFATLDLAPCKGKHYKWLLLIRFLITVERMVALRFDVQLTAFSFKRVDRSHDTGSHAPESYEKI